MSDISYLNLSFFEILAETKVNKKTSGVSNSFKRKISDMKSEGIKKRRIGGERDGTKIVTPGKWLDGKLTVASNYISAHWTTSSTHCNHPENSNTNVRINIYNLAPSVTSLEIQDLFYPYSIESASVHYEQNGNNLGTAEVVMTKKDAQRALTDLQGKIIDGSPLLLAIVGGVATDFIINRVEKVKKVVRSGIQKRSRDSHPLKARTGTKSIAKRPLFEKINKKKFSKIGIGKLNRSVSTLKSDEDLDDEFYAYMRKSEMNNCIF